MKRILTYIGIWSCSLPAMAQQQAAIPFAFDKTNYQEVLTIYTNDNRFIPGERILCKLENNLTNGKLSFVSKVAYLELIDRDRHSSLRLKIELVNGIGQGYLYLPSYLRTGNYTLIAYTSWMLNYPLYHIPQLEIQMINPFNTLPSLLVSDSIGIKFYPEGNGYIFNETTRVVYNVDVPFKNKSKTITGRLLSPSGVELASFVHDTKLPFGHFDFVPTEKGNYRIIVTDDEEHINYFSLTVAENNKLGLSARATNGGYTIKAFNKTGIGQTLTMHSIDYPKVKKTVTIATDSTFNLNQPDWPAGLTNIFFDKTDVSRLIYLPKTKNQGQVILKTDKDSYPSREKITLQLSGVELNMINASVSVRKKYDSGYHSNYISHKGNQILNKGNPFGATFDDYLILNPLAIDSASKMNYLPEYRGQILYGNALGRKISVGSIVYLSTIEEFPILKTSRTDELSNFMMHLPYFYQSKNFVLYQSQSDRISLTESFLDNYDFIHLNAHLDRTDPSWIAEKAIDVQIEDAYYHFKQDIPIDSLPANYFEGSVNKTYHLDDYTRFSTLRETFVEITPDLRIRERENQILMSMPYVENSSGAIDTCLVLLDGMPMYAREFLELDPTRLKKIDLIIQQVKLGYPEYRGITLVTSFSGDGSLLNNKSGYVSTTILPFQRRVKYFQPNYNTGESSIPDHRSQLLWIPEVQISKELKLEFFSSDLEGTYEIVVQGKDSDQNYYFTKSTFEVKNKK